MAAHGGWAAEPAASSRSLCASCRDLTLCGALGLYQKATQDLARGRLGNAVHELEAADLLVRRYLIGDPVEQIVAATRRPQHHECFRHLAGLRIRAGHDGTVG